MNKERTEVREWSSILLFSLPFMGANLLQFLYNLADSVIVGNLISATALGAVGLTSSMIWLLTAICTSIGAGVNIAVAQYFGAKKETDIQRRTAGEPVRAEEGGGEARGRMIERDRKPSAARKETDGKSQ